MLDAAPDSLERWRDDFSILFDNTFAELDRVVQTLVDVVGRKRLRRGHVIASHVGVHQ